MHYSLSHSSWDEKEVSAIRRVIESGRLTMGAEVRAYELEFAKKMGSRYAVAVNSGSSANLLAIAALTFKKDNPLCSGDEVIVPALSWPTMFYPVCQYRMKLVFVDIGLGELNLDPRLLEGALSDNTRAVFLPHILGNPARVSSIQAFCEAHDLYLIEDACESLGAVIDFRQPGTFGICGTFSTYFCHHISTIEGGVVVTDNEEIYHILLALRSHGWTRELPYENTLCEKVKDDFYEKYRFVLPGYNMRPLEISAAIGREQLKKLDGIVAVRRANARYFKEKFEGDENFTLQEERGKSSWFGFSMVVSRTSTLKRSTIAQALHVAGIEARPIISGNFLKSEVVRHLHFRRGCANFMMADHVHEAGFYVGNHSVDMRKQIDFLSSVLSKLG